MKDRYLKHVKREIESVVSLDVGYLLHIFNNIPQPQEEEEEVIIAYVRKAEEGGGKSQPQPQPQPEVSP
tara:strand:- start:113 stop:319 length:207 start_codon:yes stop_codon:yes gene_type:complete